VKVGKHTIKISLEGYKPFEREIEIEKEKTTKIRISLEKDESGNIIYKEIGREYEVVLEKEEGNEWGEPNENNPDTSELDGRWKKFETSLYSFKYPNDWVVKDQKIEINFSNDGNTTDMIKIEKDKNSMAIDRNSSGKGYPCNEIQRENKSVYVGNIIKADKYVIKFDNSELDLCANSGILVKFEKDKDKYEIFLLSEYDINSSDFKNLEGVLDNLLRSFEWKNSKQGSEESFTGILKDKSFAGVKSDNVDFIACRPNSDYCRKLKVESEKINNFFKNNIGSCVSVYGSVDGEILRVKRYQLESGEVCKSTAQNEENTKNLVSCSSTNMLIEAEVVYPNKESGLSLENLKNIQIRTKAKCDIVPSISLVIGGVNKEPLWNSYSSCRNIGSDKSYDVRINRDGTTNLSCFEFTEDQVKKIKDDIISTLFYVDKEIRVKFSFGERIDNYTEIKSQPLHFVDIDIKKEADNLLTRDKKCALGSNGKVYEINSKEFLYIVEASCPNEPIGTPELHNKNYTFYLSKDKGLIETPIFEGYDGTGSGLLNVFISAPKYPVTFDPSTRTLSYVQLQDQLGSCKKEAQIIKYKLEIKGSNLKWKYVSKDSFCIETEYLKPAYSVPISKVKPGKDFALVFKRENFTPMIYQIDLIDVNDLSKTKLIGLYQPKDIEGRFPKLPEDVKKGVYHVKLLATDKDAKIYEVYFPYQIDVE